MVNSHTSFGNLKDVIVGRELNLNKRLADITFKLFYREALGESIYETIEDTYYVNQDLITQRNEELDNLANVLAHYSINVHRPDKLEKITPFATPYFKSEVSSASNVRDITWVYGNKLIETPTFVRNRYFENMLLYDVFNKATKGSQWIKSPNTKLNEDTIDREHWTAKRDYNNIPERFEMAIDGAQFLRIGKDVIVNINSYNHYLGYQWVKSFYPETNFHVIHVADNHIDGAIACLKPGVFLINPKYNNIRNIMPDKFKHWTYLYPDDLTKTLNVKGMTNLDIQLASSRGMDINVLSINENTIISNERAIGVNECLSSNGFDVVPVKLENGEIFAGGIHCSTLDLTREDEMYDYA